MSEKKILVIDDSATIRKLVDTHLSGEGYNVVLAATAEQGLTLAEETRPDLIILDHQLPGTTGYEVCQQLLASPELRQIPVVASSTLRKRAYVEYTDCDNVIDMLPKPYTEELLKTTIANALETAAMIVESQSRGTAVPEVIHQAEDAALAGTFAGFSLREVLDFLNNGGKCGALEVEAERFRLWFYLGRGRIQGVTATGVSADELEQITNDLPPSLANLAAVLKLTISGRGGAEIDGLIQLLDQKVLDPRLTAKLLRFQSAMLVRLAFTRPLTAFRFHAGKTVPALHRELPIDSSLLALLVEQAVHGDESNLPPDDERTRYVRRSIRGQNLDRAGLAARHMKILNLLAEPQSVASLVRRLGWEVDEVRRVLHGFVLAELVEARQESAARRVVLFEPDPAEARQSRATFGEGDERYAVKVVRDSLAFQLLLKRSANEPVVFAADGEAHREAARAAFAAAPTTAGGGCRIAIVPAGEEPADLENSLGFRPTAVVSRPCTPEKLYDLLGRLPIPDGANGATTNAAAVAPDAGDRGQSAGVLAAISHASDPSPATPEVISR